MSFETAQSSLPQIHRNLLPAARLFAAVAFLMAVIAFMSFTMGLSTNGTVFLAVAAMVGGYMAMNIGANDVANNVGPAVGAGALTMGGAVIVAALFEFAGAMIAGGDVVGTIKSNVINPEMIADQASFVWLMLAALFAGAVWLNIATYLGAPVSTTHSIVGGVLGAGIAAGGWNVANWEKVTAIVASWVISPLMGGSIAAILLFVIMRLIIDQKDIIKAALRYVPYLLALMTWSFTTYLVLKGLKKIWHVDFLTAAGLGLIAAMAIFVIVKPILARKSRGLKNGRDSLNQLFTLPLISAAALLSFAHGANDVANAIGPLAAINDALSTGAVTAKSAIPIWVMGIGAIGIAVGLALYGPKLIRTVGSEITHLDKTRAFCVALAAAITVIVASQLGLPVSSTHIAVGGVFGVGFLREYLEANRVRMVTEFSRRIKGKDKQAIERFLAKFRAAAFAEQGRMIKRLKKNGNKELYLARKHRKSLRSVYRKELVKRSMVMKIAAAWVITVPASGLMAAIFYYTIRGFMLP